jgi:hypothetical protein
MICIAKKITRVYVSDSHIIFERGNFTPAKRLYRVNNRNVKRIVNLIDSGVLVQDRIITNRTRYRVYRVTRNYHQKRYDRSIVKWHAERRIRSWYCDQPLNQRDNKTLDRLYNRVWLAFLNTLACA